MCLYNKTLESHRSQFLTSDGRWCSQARYRPTDVSLQSCSTFHRPFLKHNREGLLKLHELSHKHCWLLTSPKKALLCLQLFSTVNPLLSQQLLQCKPNNKYQVTHAGLVIITQSCIMQSVVSLALLSKLHSMNAAHSDQVNLFRAKSKKKKKRQFCLSHKNAAMDPNVCRVAVSLLTCNNRATSVGSADVEEKKSWPCKVLSSHLFDHTRSMSPLSLLDSLLL